MLSSNGFYSDDDGDDVNSYSDYISVRDASNLVRIPESMPLELAAMLPCGGLAAYSAVQRVKPFILEKLENTSGKCQSRHCVVGWCSG